MEVIGMMYLFHRQWIQIHRFASNYLEKGELDWKTNNVQSAEVWNLLREQIICQLNRVRCLCKALTRFIRFAYNVVKWNRFGLKIQWFLKNQNKSLRLIRISRKGLVLMIKCQAFFLIHEKNLTLLFLIHSVCRQDYTLNEKQLARRLPKVRIR